MEAPYDDKSIRPTTDRTKESLFNIFFDKINEDCIFLDIFSGSGAIGIEALSRGVKEVIFVEKEKKAISLIMHNLRGIEGNYEIIESDYIEALKTIKRKDIKADIIFCDPPYKEKLGNEILENIYKNDTTKFGSIIVIEREKTFEKPSSNFFHCYDSRSYASSSIDFFVREKRVALTGTFDPFTNGHLYLLEKAKKIFDRIYIVLLINKDKTTRYSLEKRKEIVKIAIESEGDNIIIDNYDGLAIDYCHSNDIQYILRGARNSTDMAYEFEMSEYNYKYGKIKTIILPAKENDISSSLVREKLEKKQDISLLVHKDIEKILKE